MQYTTGMGILDRLGNVVKSYLNDESGKNFGSGRARNFSNRDDGDLNAAFEELEEFLSGGEKTAKAKAKPHQAAENPRLQLSEEQRRDLATLGLSPDVAASAAANADLTAFAAECKAAYKKLLKSYHPDHHAGNPEAVRIATEKTAEINAAYSRIGKWLKI